MLAIADSAHVSQNAQRARCWLVGGGEVAKLRPSLFGGVLGPCASGGHVRGLA